MNKSVANSSFNRSPTDSNYYSASKGKGARIILKNRGPCEFQTHDPRIKSPLLYRLSYRPHADTPYVDTMLEKCNR